MDSLYLAASGMVTSVGSNTLMTNASVKAGISAYSDSEFLSSDKQLIKSASVPSQFLDQIDSDIEEGAIYSNLYDRLLKMSIDSIRQALSDLNTDARIPIVLALHESRPDVHCDIPNELLYQNIPSQKGFPCHRDVLRPLKMGRAGGMHAITDAIRYVTSYAIPYVLSVGCDSFYDFKLIRYLDKHNRLLTNSKMNGFVCGEAAGALLLTPHKHLALVDNGHVISIRDAGLSHEENYLNSGRANKGEALDLAFKKVLREPDRIQTIYSTMNGERFWSKEFGVAMIRNKHFFVEDPVIHHPAEYLGDIGSASSSVFIALAAQELLQSNQLSQTLVYASSDTHARGATVLTKERI